MGIVTLLTDFGTADSYVGEVKAVLLSQSPLATLVDITHHVPPGNVRAAAYLFERSWKNFPPGSVHLVVVDPGVGTDRAALVLALQDHFFVGPDNGVFTSILAQPSVIATTLPIPEDASATFHGRDVFARAAATLANRGWWPELGTRLVGPGVRLEERAPEQDSGGWIGEIVHVDHFGNLVTNLQPRHLSAGSVVQVSDVEIAIVNTYGEVKSGALLAYVGSGGTLEIAVRGGSAVQVLRAEVGQRVRIKQT
jgi:S-adenosyl-L-methionine hydrolase (adenosine-forming)